MGQDERPVAADHVDLPEHHIPGQEEKRARRHPGDERDDRRPGDAGPGRDESGRRSEDQAESGRGRRDDHGVESVVQEGRRLGERDVVVERRREDDRRRRERDDESPGSVLRSMTEVRRNCGIP